MDYSRENIVGRKVVRIWLVNTPVDSDDFYYEGWDMYVELSCGQCINMQVMPHEINTNIKAVEHRYLHHAIEDRDHACCYGREVVEVYNSHVPSLAILLSGDLLIFNDYDLHSTCSICVTLDEVCRRGWPFVTHWGGKSISKGV